MRCSEQCVVDRFGPVRFVGARGSNRFDFPAVRFIAVCCVSLRSSSQRGVLVAFDCVHAYAYVQFAVGCCDSLRFISVRCGLCRFVTLRFVGTGGLRKFVVALRCGVWFGSVWFILDEVHAGAFRLLHVAGRFSSHGAGSIRLIWFDCTVRRDREENRRA